MLYLIEIIFRSFIDQEEFSTESIEAIKSVLLGSCFHATVSGYHYDNIPFVQLTKRYGRVGRFEKEEC